MDDIEIIMFKEVNNYNEKFYGFTFRQWLFSALIAIIAIPTYILLPKYTPITQNIASYFVILEAGIIGFFGFIKINELPAEHIAPYWYRHIVYFGKPIKFISNADWEEAHSKKRKKNHTMNVSDSKSNAFKDKSLKITKKQLKQQKKKEKMLIKARKKYGYLLDEENVQTNSVERNINKNLEPLSTATVESKYDADNVLSQLSSQQKEALLKALQKNNE